MTSQASRQRVISAQCSESQLKLVVPPFWDALQPSPAHLAVTVPSFRRNQSWRLKSISEVEVMAHQVATTHSESPSPLCLCLEEYPVCLHHMRAPIVLRPAADIEG